MKVHPWLAAGLLLGSALVLGLIAWGWRQGGLAVLQLGMSLC